MLFPSFFLILDWSFSDSLYGSYFSVSLICLLNNLLKPSLIQWMVLLGFLQEIQTCTKFNLKATCRVKYCFWFCNSVKGNLTSRKHLLYISTFCLHCLLLSCSFSLLYSSNNLCTCLSLCLECSSTGFCKNPSLKFRSYKGFPFKIPTTLFPSSFLPKFLQNSYHHFSYFIYFAIC